MPTPPAQAPKRRRPSSPPSPAPTPMRAPKRPHNAALTKPFKSPLKPPNTPASSSTATPSKAPSNRPSAHDVTAMRAAQSDIAALEQALRLLAIPVPPDTHTPPRAAENIYARVDAGGTPVPAADARLEARTRSWRQAAREAAETVRADMGARISDAGGLRAWRARERDAVQAGWGAAERREDEQEQELEGLSALERREVQRLREEAEEARADEEELCKPHDGTEADADYDGGGELTMGVMLGMLHVDPALLGWLEDEQRWRDELD